MEAPTPVNAALEPGLNKKEKMKKEKLGWWFALHVGRHAPCGLSPRPGASDDAKCKARAARSFVVCKFNK